MENIKNMENEAKDRFKNAAAEMDKYIKQGQEQLKTLATTADKKLKENPWPIVLGVAAGSLLLGYFMAASRRRD